MKCLICGRKIRSARSLKIGMGHVCAKRDKQQLKFEFYKGNANEQGGKTRGTDRDI